MQIPVIDLFAGPGGLGEGFSSEIAGKYPFLIKVSVEKDTCAHKTLSLRAFFRYFRNTNRPVPPEYYDYLAGKITRNKLEDSYPSQWKQAYMETICAELGLSRKDHQPLIDKNISDSIGKTKDWVLIGGPPCQAYSLIGRARTLGHLRARNENTEINDEAIRAEFEADKRHKLYRQYLRIIAKHSPAIFVMENVKGILSSTLNGKLIFPKILQDLKDPEKATRRGRRGYEAQEHKYHIVSFVTGVELEENDAQNFLIKAEMYGVPQMRHRVILLGIRDDLYKKVKGEIPMLSQCPEEITLDSVIGGFPKLRSGFSKEEDSLETWKKHFENIPHRAWFSEVDDDIKMAIQNVIKQILMSNYPRASSQRPETCNSLQSWYEDNGLKCLPNHSTRAHLSTDLDRYLFVSVYGLVRNKSPHLKDFPISLLPLHKNVIKDDECRSKQKFSDRFKVQLRNKPSSTVTCHIAKDGHYFINPDPAQCRGLTVREVARLQTFPDNYFFEGGRTQQFHQVGNAVPPYLAKQLAEIVFKIFQNAL